MKKKMMIGTTSITANAQAYKASVAHVRFVSPTSMSGTSKVTIGTPIARLTEIYTHVSNRILSNVNLPV